MRRAWLVWLVSLLPLAAAAQSPYVRARIEPAQGILVGQPVRLVVSVFVPNYFTGSPDFPEFELENAIVVLPQDRPENSNEQIGGITYAGITQTYTLYPQQPGDFRLPPAEITVSYASAPPKSTTAHLTLPALTFHAEVPAAARDLDYFLPTTQLIIEQKWSVPLKNLRAGDTVERTITVTAAKMQAMLIPPLRLDAPDGIRVYPEEPAVQDQKTDRGEFVFGRRKQAAKYFIQKAGDYTLPAIELKWWNLTTNRLATATLPAVHFSAAANPNFVAELPPEPEPVAVAQTKHVSPWIKYRFWIRIVAPCCVAGLILLWLGWRYSPRIVRGMRARRFRREHSEAAYFRKCLQACQRGQPMEAYQSFLKWLRMAYPGVTVEDFVSGLSDSGLTAEAEQLGAALFATSQNHQWDGKKMGRLLKEHRRTRAASFPKHRRLMELNP
jgi:hypothetical protein